MKDERDIKTADGGISWENDGELFGIIKKYLYTAVVGDIMDQMGYYHQFLPPQIRPLGEDTVMAGRAMTVQETDITPGETYEDPILNKPFGLMLEALDDLKPGEIYLCSGASPDYALWGELMCTRARKLGAAGAVVNGYIRDTKGIRALNFPVFSCGQYAQDQAPRGKVTAYRVPLQIAGVTVEPGDILVGDCDGVVAIPQKIEEEVIRRAYEKATGENMVKGEIEKGMSCKEAFARYKIM